VRWYRTGTQPPITVGRVAQRETDVGRLLPPAEIEFSVVFAGPALASGRMPVAQLAPALLALGEIFQDANSRVNVGELNVELQFRAAERGSFEALLILGQVAPGSGVTSLLAGTGATALANLLTFINGGSGLFHYLMFRRGKQEVSEVSDPATPGLVRVEFVDGTTFTAQTAAIDMAKDVRILREVRDLTAPLNRPGVEQIRIEITDSGIPNLSITREDAEDLAAIPEGTDLPNVANVVLDLEVVGPIVTDDNYQWRFTLGGEQITARMRDSRFQSEAAAGVESFTGGDVLRCMVQINQVQNRNGKVSTRYEIVQVLEHRQNGRLFNPKPPAG